MNHSLELNKIMGHLHTIKQQVKQDEYYKLLNSLCLLCNVEWKEWEEKMKMTIEYKKGQ